MRYVSVSISLQWLAGLGEHVGTTSGVIEAVECLCVRSVISGTEFDAVKLSHTSHGAQA